MRDPHTLTPSRVNIATVGLKTFFVNQSGLMYRVATPTR
jgi:hypothetical protein